MSEASSTVSSSNSAFLCPLDLEPVSNKNIYKIDQYFCNCLVFTNYIVCNAPNPIWGLFPRMNIKYFFIFDFAGLAVFQDKGFWQLHADKCLPSLFPARERRSMSALGKGAHLFLLKDQRRCCSPSWPE